MLNYARNIALLSLLVSAITASLVFARDPRPDDPADPQHPQRRCWPSPRRPTIPTASSASAARKDELGVAERELAGMQTQLQRILGEQKHLADLGLAVSKINHDMRNILASAQLISDRLRLVKDPTVQAFAPKLLRALDRAVAYSEGVLAYGRTQEPAPVRRRLRLRQLVEEVQGMLGLDAVERHRVREPGRRRPSRSTPIPSSCSACSPISAATPCRRWRPTARARWCAASRFRPSAPAASARILVTDTGPGLPQKARENLFSAFRGSARSGGTGLGLAIAHELVRAHGGTIRLVESVSGRTVFAITIPDRPVRLDEVRAGPAPPGLTRRPDGEVARQRRLSHRRTAKFSTGAGLLFAYQSLGSTPFAAGRSTGRRRSYRSRPVARP